MVAMIPSNLSKLSGKFSVMPDLSTPFLLQLKDECACMCGLGKQGLGNVMIDGELVVCQRQT